MKVPEVEADPARLWCRVRLGEGRRRLGEGAEQGQDARGEDGCASPDVRHHIASSVKTRSCSAEVRTIGRIGAVSSGNSWHILKSVRVEPWHAAEDNRRSRDVRHRSPGKGDCGAGEA